jgi:hypothetical protein
MSLDIGVGSNNKKASNILNIRGLIMPFVVRTGIEPVLPE